MSSTNVNGLAGKFNAFINSGGQGGLGPLLKANPGQGAAKFAAKIDAALHAAGSTMTSAELIAQAREAARTAADSVQVSSRPALKQALRTAVADVLKQAGIDPASLRHGTTVPVESPAPPLTPAPTPEPTQVTAVPVATVDVTA